MARRSTAEEIAAPEVSLHPKLSEQLVAHGAAEKQLLALINAGKLPHALLITGLRGIGKATLAYRLARFLLAPQAADSGLFGEAPPPETLKIAASHPTFRRVVAGSHPDLLVLDAEDIKIEDARKVAAFLSLTPAESAWRVVIVDSADAMNRNAANALLKTLEEPPAKAVILLVSHTPGMLLPTIRSRCRALRLVPLPQADFARIMAGIAPDLQPSDYPLWSLLSDGSPGVALALIEAGADTLYRELLERVASPDTLKLHSFADGLARKDKEAQWKVFERLFLWMLARIAEVKSASSPEVFAGERHMLLTLADARPLEFWTDLWEKAGTLFSDADRLHLDKKQSILSLLRAAGE